MRRDIWVKAMMVGCLAASGAGAQVARVGEESGGGLFGLTSLAQYSPWSTEPEVDQRAQTLGVQGLQVIQFPSYSAGNQAAAGQFDSHALALANRAMAHVFARASGDYRYDPNDDLDEKDGAQFGLTVEEELGRFGMRSAEGAPERIVRQTADRQAFERGTFRSILAADATKLTPQAVSATDGADFVSNWIARVENAARGEAVFALRADRGDAWRPVFVYQVVEEGERYVCDFYDATIGHETAGAWGGRENWVEKATETKDRRFHRLWIQKDGGSIEVSAGWKGGERAGKGAVKLDRTRITLLDQRSHEAWVSATLDEDLVNSGYRHNGLKYKARYAARAAYRTANSLVAPVFASMSEVPENARAIARDTAKAGRRAVEIREKADFFSGRNQKILKGAIDRISGRGERTGSGG